MALGVACWFFLSAGPAQAMWLSEEERALFVQRHREAAKDKRALEQTGLSDAQQKAEDEGAGVRVHPDVQQ